MPATDFAANRARAKSTPYAYEKGVTTGANRFDLKGMWQTEPVNALLGSTLIDGLDVIGGVTVTVINLGTALEQAALQAANGHAVTNALTRFRKASGKVAFADNQVALDFTSTGELPTLSSVLLFSLDDVGMEDNQIEEFSGQTVLFDVIEIALTARMGGNRIAQDLGGKRRVSAIVVGAATQVTSNTTTYCLGSFASTPQFRVFANNLELIATSHDACAFADNLAEIYGTAIVDYLLT
jgi:hypothetical protein